MIRINRPTTGPRILSNVKCSGYKATQLLKSSFDAGTRAFTFNRDIYSSKSVRSQLSKIQNGKCCFCESIITHVSYGDVEHFRPKGGYQQRDTDPLSAYGYYWLAYDWNNLLLSCTLCNQRHKRNLFPLLAPTKRAVSHNSSIDDESPVFINPACEDPEIYIGFRKEVAYGKDSGDRGKTTITELALNRYELTTERLKVLDTAKLSQRTVGVLQKIARAKGLSKELKLLLQEHQAAIGRFKSSGQSYTAMLRAAKVI